MNISRQFLFLPKLVRFNDWWYYLINPLIAFYLLASFLENNPEVPVWSFHFVAFMALSCSIAAFGFVINDLTDIRDDRLSGKTNAIGELPVSKRVIVLTVIVILNVVTIYLFNPHQFQTRILIIHYFAILLYSVKPIRLKKYLFPAAFLDALYSSAIPFLFAFTIFKHDIVMLGIVFGIGILKGLRNILSHLLEDEKKDALIREKTITGMVKKENLMRFKILLFAAENILLAILLIDFQLPMILIIIPGSLTTCEMDV